MASDVERIADAVDRNAGAMADLASASNRRFAVAYGGLVISLIAVLAIGNMARVRADENSEKIKVLAAQNFCHLAVQGAYLEHLGEVIELNRTTLDGETVDKVKAAESVASLRRDAQLMGRLNEVCDAEHPDPTPLDGVLPDGRNILVERTR